MKILLVEDNEGDIVLTLEALKEGKLKHDVIVTRDGMDAIFYLNKEEKYLRAETPDIILLDINLPKVDGKEVLKFVKTSETLCAIPVIMLTTSSSEKDVKDAYTSHANCFITKPSDLNQFINVVQVIENYWSSIVQLPSTFTIKC